MDAKKAAELVKGDVIATPSGTWVVSGAVTPHVYDKARVDVPLRRNEVGGTGTTIAFAAGTDVTMSDEPNRRAGL